MSFDVTSPPLDKDDRILAVLAASLVGDDAAVVFDVLLIACAKRLLVCEPALSADDREKVMAIVDSFVGPPDQLLAEWQGDWVELLDSFHGNHAEAMIMFLDAV
jgi:hypothetical protein